MSTMLRRSIVANVARHPDLLGTGVRLAPATLSGNWAAASDEAAWKMHSRDFRGAATIL